MTNKIQTGKYVYSYYLAEPARAARSFFAVSLSADEDLPVAIRRKSLKVEFWDRSQRVIVPELAYAEGGFIDCHLPDSRHAASLRLENENYLLSVLDAGKILQGVNCSGDFRLNAIATPRADPAVYQRYSKCGVSIFAPDT
jgi:hypothetical protein